MVEEVTEAVATTAVVVTDRAPARAEEMPANAAAPTLGMPQVTAFALPTDELARLADGAGLQWVNSDADKVAAVHAAIAAEPRAARVPRERPPLPALDDGPLVLVETRKDLSAVQLAFELTPAEPGQSAPSQH